MQTKYEKKKMIIDDFMMDLTNLTNSPRFQYSFIPMSTFSFIQIFWKCAII